MAGIVPTQIDVQVCPGTQKSGLVSSVGPISQASTNSFADVVGSAVDARPWRSVSYTLIGDATNIVKWQVLAGNAPDFSDAVIVQASASVAANAIASFTDTASAYGYYKVQIESATAGDAGTVTINGLLKGGV